MYNLLEADVLSDLPIRHANKEAPHSCREGVRVAVEPRVALSSSAPLSPSRQESRDSLLLTRLVALNHDRAAAEKKGLIRCPGCIYDR
jgi:hypothetical protein